MGAVYKSICFEVDSIMLRMTTLSEKHIQMKINIEKQMNEGFVNIAKTRYIMGTSCITKMQLPTENSNPIKPVATVYREEINNNWVFKIERKDCPKKLEDTGSELFELPGEDPGIIISDRSSDKSSCRSVRSEGELKNLLKNDPKSIKQSKIAFLVKDGLYKEYENDLLDEISDTDSNESLISVTDPIRLFGVLVPNSLKNAQSAFKNVVNLLGECATIQAELRETILKLNHLLDVKKLIEEAAEDLKIDFLIQKTYWTPSETSSISYYSYAAEGEDEECYRSGKQLAPKKRSIRSVLYYDEEDMFQAQEEEYAIFGSDSGSDYDGNGRRK